MSGPVFVAAWCPSIYCSDTVRPVASKTVTVTVIILAIPFADFETVLASSAYKLPHTALRRMPMPMAPLFRPPHSPGVEPNPLFRTMSSSSLKHSRTTGIAAAKNTLNSKVDSTQPCRSPCVTSNRSECSPLSVRAQAHMASWNWRVSCEHLRWCTEACEHPPQKLSVDRVVCFLLIDEARVQGGLFSSLVRARTIGARRIAFRLLIVRYYLQHLT